MSITVDLNIVITYSLSILVFMHSYKFRGLFKSLLLFLGAVVVGGGVENANSLLGGYHYPGSDLTIFMVDCPFDVVLGWYVLIYCCTFMSHTIIGKGKGSLQSIGIGTDPENGVDKSFIKLAILRGMLAGLFAVLIDLLIDPVAVENKWWVWEIHNIYIQGVPLGNYIGWWMLISTSAIFYDIIVTYGSLKNKERYKTAAMWCGGTIAAALITGGILSQLVLLFSMDGIRTEGLGTNDLATQLAMADWGRVFLALIAVLVGLGLIMLASFAPDNANPLEGKFWNAFPSILMIIFWAMVMVVAFLTGPIFILIGFTQGFIIVLISLYLILKTYRD